MMGLRRPGRRRLAARALVCSLLAGLVISGFVIGGLGAQEAAGSPYEDAARVDSLRQKLAPERLERYRREAFEEGGPRQLYDLGAALLLRGDWEGAVEPLQRAALSGDGDVEGSASYNLGVAHGVGGRPAVGRASPPGGDDARRSSLLQAREAFRRVLRADPSADDARWNLEVVGSWLDELGGGGDGGGGGGGGDQGQGSAEGREMTPEELERLLAAAASEERRVQENRFERSRARDPVAERNW